MPGLLQGGLGRARIFRVPAIQPQAARLGQRQAVLQRQRLHGGRLQLQAAAGRAVRLGQHQSDVETFGQQALQGRRGKLRRAGETRCAWGRWPSGAVARGALFLARFLQHLLLDAVALERAEVFHEHLAQQVVHLVLHAHGGQAFGIELIGFKPSRPSARTLTWAWRCTLS